jgi:hypothetical protein
VRRQGESKTALLDAAVRVIRTQGLHATSLVVGEQSASPEQQTFSEVFLNRVSIGEDAFVDRETDPIGPVT